MSATLLRLGLWTTFLIIVAYVIRATYAEAPLSQYVSDDLLYKMLIVSVLVVIAGVIVRVLEKGSKAVVKNRCRVCQAPVPHGAIYCRAHLRSVLHDEEDRTHSSRRRT